MKKTIKVLVYIFVLLILASGVFFFWAKSSNLSESEYAKIQKFPVESNASSDSIYSIITYNIGYLSGMTNNLAVRPSEEFYQENLDTAVGLFNQMKADIIAFQEIDYGSNRSYYINQHEVLAENCQYQFGASIVNWDKMYVPFPYWPPSVHFGKIISGQSVLSRFPIVDNQRDVLEKVASNPYHYNAIYLERVAQVVKLLIDGREVMLINAHTEAFDQPTRTNHVEYLYNMFQELRTKYPVLLVGDFNSDPNYENSAILKFLNDGNIGSACPSSDVRMEYALTYPSDKPYEQLDYIFYSPEHFKEMEWGVLHEFGQISDHLPVLLKFAFR